MSNLISSKVLNIVFYVNGLPFTGDTLKEKGLGGSETMGLCMAKEMAARGHRVTMFCNCEKPGIYDKVIYLNLGENSHNFFRFLQLTQVDVLIVQRLPEVFNQITNNSPLRSKLNILWQHDLGRISNIGIFRGSAWNIDKVFCLSDFHLNQQSEVFSLPKDFFHKTRNGIEPIKLNPNIRRQTKRLIFTGRPERGVDILLETLPRIWNKDPEIKMAFSWYDCPNPSIQPFYDQLLNQMKQYGDKVEFLGHLTKEKLYEEYQKSTLYTYCTDFEDTYHIAGIEAAACGLPVIATPKGALPETLCPEGSILVGDGRDGEAREPQYQERFAIEVVKLINSPDKLKEMGSKSIEYAKSLTNENLAAEWEEYIYKLFDERTENKDRLAKHFYNTRDIKTLWQLNIPEWNCRIKKEAPNLLGNSKYLEFWKEEASLAKQVHIGVYSETPRISIIIPTVRGNKALEVVKNLDKKSNNNHEYIIIENGINSKVPISEEEKELNLKLINNEENVGFTKAVNQGIQKASHNYIAIVNDDIFSFSDWDFKLTSLMKKYNIDYISPNTNNLNANEEIIDYFYSSFMIITKKLIEEIGLFDERFFLVFQDVDFQERMRDKGFLCYTARDVHAVHLHSQSRKFLGLELDNNREDTDHEAFIDKWKDREDVLEKHPKIPKVIRDAQKKARFDQIVTEYRDEEYKKYENQKIQTIVKELKESESSHLLDISGDTGTDSIILYNELPIEITKVCRTKEELEIVENFFKKYCNEDKNRKINFIIAGDPSKLPNNIKCDAVYCSNHLEQVSSPSKFINDLESKIPENTRMFFITPSMEYQKCDLNENRKHHILWNFERSDLYDLFGEKSEFLIRVLGSPTPEDGIGRLNKWHYVTYRKSLIPTWCPTCQGSSKLISENCISCGTKLQEPKIGTIDFNRKISIQSPRETLTLSMITYNKEEELLKTLKSVKGLVDDIVVADANSTDRTREMLKQFNAKIIDVPKIEAWKFGFDDARNATLPHIKTDWVMWLDSDEQLLTPYNLFKYLRPNIYNGYSIHQHHHSAQPPNAFTPDLPVRLFRNNKNITFLGSIHEHPRIPGEESVGESILIDNNEVCISHSGYLTEDIRRGRFERNFPLLLMDRQKNPDRVLGKFLYIRDLLHLAKYEFQQTGGRLTQQIVDNCNLAISMYKKDFLENPDIVSGGGITYYHEALAILNIGQFYRFSIGVDLKGQPNTREETYKFESPEVFLKYYNARVKSITKYLTGKYL